MKKSVMVVSPTGYIVKFDADGDPTQEDDSSALAFKSSGAEGAARTIYVNVEHAMAVFIDDVPEAQPAPEPTKPTNDNVIPLRRPQK